MTAPSSHMYCFPATEMYGRAPPSSGQSMPMWHAITCVGEAEAEAEAEDWGEGWGEG